MNYKTNRPPHQVDITNCDKEPIHILGLIQSHGYLFVLEESFLKILQTSENTTKLFGKPINEILGSHLSLHLGTDNYRVLESSLKEQRLRRVNPIKLEISTKNGKKKFDGILHRNDGFLILEMEEHLAPSMDFLKFQQEAHDTISSLREAKDISELANVAVKEIRRLTGFDRVVIYKFDELWNGAVIAEAKDPGVDSYLGLHFPASDIPKQARELYQKNPIRIISNVEEQGSRIIPYENPITLKPIDLSFSILRSVSPIHIEYLKNMKCQASMSISLIKDRKLWGLISCTHLNGPRYTPYETRALCELLGEIMSSLLIAKEEYEGYDQKLKASIMHGNLLDYMTREIDFVNGLIAFSPNLLDLVNATGAAVYVNGQFSMIGKTPTDVQIGDLIKWIGRREDQELLITDSLPTLFPEAREYKDVASGLLAASLSRRQKNYVLWFRPEVIQTVHWGGNPEKPVNKDQGTLHPRKSFEAWKETLRLRSLPWKPFEIEVARELRKSIIDIVLQKSEDLLKLNNELERSNDELDSFAYAASHDLKEPLRGIHNFTNLALRESGEILQGKSKERLETVVRLSQRMEDLINSLLHYSQVGRMELSMREQDMNEIVLSVKEMLKLRLEESNGTIIIPRPLPKVRCDRIRVSEVFSNLITNALKYNDQKNKTIEIGFKESKGPIIFYVKDNGIGIEEDFKETVFKIFKRLHGRDKFGGGTGTGLTITKRIIERHNGKIWLASQPKAGSTFFFTLDGESTHE